MKEWPEKPFLHSCPVLLHAISLLLTCAVQTEARLECEQCSALINWLDWDNGILVAPRHDTSISEQTDNDGL